jgi:hypothetical protein
LDPWNDDCAIIIRADKRDVRGEIETVEVQQEKSGTRVTHEVIPIVIASFVSGLAGALTQKKICNPLAVATPIGSVWSSVPLAVSYRGRASFGRIPRRSSNCTARLLERFFDIWQTLLFLLLPMRREGLWRAW